MVTRPPENNGFELIVDKLKEFKKKYYLNTLLKGIILSISILISVFLIFNTLEFTLRFNSMIRGLFFFSFLVAFTLVIYFWVIIPINKLFRNGQQISDEEAARQIGSYFPNISDKLLNTIQLQKISSVDNSLILASIAQRTSEIRLVSFADAIDLRQNKKFLKFLAGPALALFILMIFVPQMLTESTTRIIRYKEAFLPEAPFKFKILNDQLLGFKNEDYTLNLGFEGHFMPDQAYMNLNGRKMKMKKGSDGLFSYTFKKLQSSADMSFEAAGFNSDDYHIKVVSRPNLKGFNVYLVYPSYVNKENERLNNVGNLQIVEGTKVKWQISTIEADSMSFKFESDDFLSNTTLVDNQLFEIERKILESDNYSIHLTNKYSDNRENINYHIDAKKDEHPTINLDQLQDTVLFSYVILGGAISDDYGLTQLQVNYKIVQGSKESEMRRFNLPIQSPISQGFFHHWPLDSLGLNEGDQVKYALQVWDNDGINGRKSTQTGFYSINIPTKKEVREKLEKESQGTHNQIDNSLEKTRELQEKLKSLEERLKTKKNLEWQDERLIEELLKEKEELNKEIEKLQEKNESNRQQRERFTKQDEKIAEKMQQLQELMDELMDEETKKLYEELKKLLEEKRGLNEVQEAIENIRNKEETLEKELERTLELFKRMKMEYKMEEVINDLEELAVQQEELANETLEEQNSNEDLSETQEDLMEEFDQIEQDMEDINELNQELKNPEPIQDTSEEQSDIKQDQQKSKEAIDENKRQNSNQSQKSAAEKMKKLSAQMQEMQAGMEMEMMQVNLDNLRNIVDNLVTLSFDQEELMNDFREVNQSDPRFIELSQNQLKLKDDAKIIEDSLRSLASRVFQIASFVTREVDDMNKHINESIESLRDRNKAQSISKQQFAMTSMNNLALLLDDVLQNMQQMMADAMGNPKAGQKKGQKNMPGMSELQQQLNRKIEELKRSGNPGREMSEELAKMAAQQELIRQSIEEMQRKLDQLNNEKGENGGGSKISDVIQKMEQTELDLVNKQLTDQMIRRQRDILTRLLESEKALRERELDDEREGERANDYETIFPSAMDEYLKAKEKEIELLKTIPPKLNPYYKKEVNDYFRRLGSQ
ncbi:MAG: hypothetical protein O2887_00710 [Bacteroidetes bacterium]|nr:hypothetical protein [Bacteroidota bacterium]MDA1119010.1 hypothetical protein [Bacteroidota bacterium]